METRDILNYLGAKVGELTMPDDTSEDIWIEKLAAYSQAPKSAAELYLDMVARQQLRAPQVMQAVRQYLSTRVSTLAQAAVYYRELTPALVAVREGAFQVANYIITTYTPTADITAEDISAISAILQSNFAA